MKIRASKTSPTMRHGFFLKGAAATCLIAAGIPAQANLMVSGIPGAAQPASPVSAPVQSMSAPAAPAAPQQTAQAPNTGIFESSTAERFADRIFDVKTDSIDTNGNLRWKGKTFSVGDSRIVRARFERYLSMPANLGDYENYRSILAEIEAQLAANNDNLTLENIKYAWSRLFDAAEYQIDGDSSLVIANLVYLSWRMRDEYENFKSAENEKERDVKAAKFRAKEKAEFMEYASDKMKRLTSRRARNSQSNPTVGTADLGYRLQDLQRQVAELATAKAMKEAVATKAVWQFQSQILAFILERKFQQAQISAMFYRHIYRGNAQELQVGREQIKDLVQVSNFTPTADALEMIAIDARKDIADGMAAVETLYDKGDRYAALERLLETFLIGEQDVALAVFSPEKREVLRKIYKDAITIKELADSKDWGGVEEVVNEISKLAADFPSREVLSKVKTAQTASNMALLAAKQAAALGAADDVKKNIEKAALLWPLNPGIQAFNDELLGLTKGISTYVKKFDENVERGNFRDIMDEAPEYGIAFKNDSERAKKLREIVVKISQIDSLIAQAAEFERQKSPYFAWDILENASRIDSADPVLARAIARLAPEVSDYVKALNRAKDAENKKEFAAALNYYLAAQKIFPASQACRMGIERVAEKY
ncbi:MAG TPA: hypothetical protein IAD27_02230 [Candidatus Merdousia gallistercoris]|nr:hypothetical protein [Candidatus Merdousia gallistercoris]